MRFEVQPFGVDVIVIQPGVVDTSLGRKTAETVASQAEKENGAYTARPARFLDFLAQNSGGSHQSPLTPQDVARVIVKAVTAAQPETRYKLGEEAVRLTGMRRRLSDRQRDAIYRQLYG